MIKIFYICIILIIGIMAGLFSASKKVSFSKINKAQEKFEKEYMPKIRKYDDSIKYLFTELSKKEDTLKIQNNYLKQLLKQTTR